VLTVATSAPVKAIRSHLHAPPGSRVVPSAGRHGIPCALRSATTLWPCH